jgi:type III secretion protein V
MPPRHVVLLLSDVPARLVVLPEDLPDEQAASHVADAVFELLRSRAADFLGMHESQQLLDQLEQVAPAVVRQVIPKPLSLTLLTEVLRRLAEEGVSIRDLRLILEALATYAPQERDPMALTELTRSHLKRATTYRLTGGARSLEIYLLDPGIEEVIRSAITRTPAGSFLTLAPGPARDIVRAIKQTTDEVRPSEAQPLVLLTQPDIRRFVRKLVEGEVPDLQVISFAELLPEIQLQPLAKVEG